jgi:hypothetical protein
MIELPYPILGALITIVAAFGLGVAVWYAGTLLSDLAKRLRSRKAKALPPPQSLPDTPPQFVPPVDPWQALPGDRLELGASGFAITLHRKPGTAGRYVLHSPEGEALAMCGDGHLATLKQHGELIAGERRKFEADQAATFSISKASS